MKFFKSIADSYNQFIELHEKNSIEFDLCNIFPYYKRCLYKCLNVKAKSSPKEFWSFVILNFIIGNILVRIEETLHISFLLEGYLLLITIPFICLFIRRLNDIGKNKYWLLTPFFGLLLLKISYTIMDNDLISLIMAILLTLNVGVLLYWSFITGVKKL